MLLIDFFKNSADNWRYVGTIYGEDECWMTASEVVAMLQIVDDNSPIIDHPTSTHQGGGFYFQDEDIWYKSTNNLVCQCVFEKLHS